MGSLGCARGPCARRVSVCVPLHGVGEWAARQRPAIVGAYGTLARAWPRRGCPTTMYVGPATRRGAREQSAVPGREAETGVATGGQTTDRAGAPEFLLMNTASGVNSWPETNFCRGAECRTCYTHMVVPPFLSASFSHA